MVQYSAPRVFTADWLQFRGPGGQGTSAEAGLLSTWSAEENVIWRTPLPGPGASSPILVGDSIYLTCYTGFRVGGESIEGLKRHLVCIGRRDGKVRWQTETVAEQPEEAKNREEHGYATSTPACDGERVYVFYGRTGVIAFGLGGEELWRADVGDGTSGWGSAASPILHKELVIVNASVESESLVALDRKSGKEVWRQGGIREAWNTPILAANPAGKTELVAAVHQRLLAFEPDTGKPLWSVKTDINWYMAPSLVAHDGVVYSVGGRGSGGALAVKLGGSGDVTATHRLWTLRKGSNVTSPLVHDGHLYWMHESLGIAYCVEAPTGKLVYEERVKDAGGVYASPVLADGKLYYFNRSGRGLVLEAKPAYALLAANDLERRGVFNASPAVGDGRLFVRSDKFLYCLGTKD
jgi:hypothetical protein